MIADSSESFHRAGGPGSCSLPGTRWPLPLTVRRLWSLANGNTRAFPSICSQLAPAEACMAKMRAGSCSCCTTAPVYFVWPSRPDIRTQAQLLHPSSASSEYASDADQSRSFPQCNWGLATPGCFHRRPNFDRALGYGGNTCCCLTHRAPHALQVLSPCCHCYPQGYRCE